MLFWCQLEALLLVCVLWRPLACSLDCCCAGQHVELSTMLSALKVETVECQCPKEDTSCYVHPSLQTLCPQQRRTQQIVLSRHVLALLARLTTRVVYRTEQLRTAMAQWQNKAISAAFNSWRDHVVTKTSHSAKVGWPSFCGPSFACGPFCHSKAIKNQVEASCIMRSTTNSYHRNLLQSTCRIIQHKVFPGHVAT